MLMEPKATIEGKDVEAIRERKERARRLVNSLNFGITDWKLTDADNVNDEPDMVISASLRDVDVLLLALEKERERVEAAEEMIAGIKKKAESMLASKVKATK